VRTGTKILYFVCFVGLAVAASLALDRILHPFISGLLLRAVCSAALAAAPGLVWKRLWPLSLILLPVAAYLLLRTILPTPASVQGISGEYHFYAQALREGASTYAAQFFPLTTRDHPELRLLLAFVVFWLVGISGLIALGFRRALPAVIILLMLIGFCFTVDTTARALWSALLFLILAACLLVLSRGLQRQAWRLREAISGGLVGVIGASLALALLLTVPSAAAQPWKDWRAWDPFHEGSSVYSFNWLQNYPELLNPARNVTIMHVTSSSPSYWRANALDTFTGSAWISSQAFPTLLQVSAAQGAFAYALPSASPTPPGKTVREEFALTSVYTNYLFVGGEPHVLVMETEMPLRTNETRAIHVSRAVGPILSYTVTASIPTLKPADLVGKGDGYPAGVLPYRALPFPSLSEIRGSDKEAAWRDTMAEQGPEWSDLYSLNERIVGDAKDPYDKTLRIEQYLRKFYQYTLTPPASSYSSPYAAFLFDTHLGYCQHFAGSMALLLRFNGIPARVAVGFTTGELQRGSYAVSTNNAHAWVEVYFPHVGWVAFDPTPGRNIPTPGPSSTSPGFVNPFATNGTANAGTVSTQQPRPQLPEESQPETTLGGGGTVWSKISWLPWVAGIALVLLLWPVGRVLWRQRKLHRGSTTQRLAASLGLLRTELADRGVPIAPGLTVEETFAVIETRLGIRVDVGFSDRINAILFGGHAASQKDVDQAESFRREVKTRLRSVHGWVRTGLFWYGITRHPAQAANRS
jgi:transglutaminase-like putative cysteine protease